MAGLEGLASMIYHEKQQQGSMLCAQHALNALLQGNYFTAPDLSDIARGLDVLEGSYREEEEGAHPESRNMDDTGFFSVQVLDNALKVWGLNLVRWRSEEMRPYHEHPHTQLAFILNLEQHWFTLRRFGPAVPNIESDPGDGHWFNLNSFLAAPEWVGKLYLGMVLQQAETEGYSVFVVTQADPEGALALPRILADEVASTLPEPSSSISISRTSFQRTMESSSTTQPQPIEAERFDEEDYELQAALQASLMADRDMVVDEHEHEDASAPPPVPRGIIPLPMSAAESPNFSGPPTGTQTPLAPLLPEFAEVDPVAASMARNRQLLERMRQQQEFAQRELWSETDLDPEEAEALQQRREARRREEEQEQEELRRAIEESEHMAKSHGRLSQKEDDSGEDEIIEDFDPSSRPSNLTPAYYNADRVYDDDDPELQAALKASLEHLPPGFQHPEFEEPAHPSYPASQSAAAPITNKDREDNASIASTETSVTESVSPEPVSEQLSVDEIRRRRLARFGT